MKNYKQNLLNELRLVAYEKDSKDLTDEALVKAMTINEELMSYGYTLKPMDIISLAKSKSLNKRFIDNFKDLLEDVKAKPMYPNFPTQVMEMDEATFRLHQLIHYFSTYGMELLFGVTVKKGWLPDVEDTEKTKADTTLLDAKVIELIDIADMYTIPLEKILSKRERMTNPEKEIVGYASAKVNPDYFNTVEIPFKENMYDICSLVVDSSNGLEPLDILKNICKHTGDVFKVTDCYIGTHGYKIKNSKKKLFVMLFESYKPIDFKSNIILSNKKSKRNKLILNYIDYNQFSKSDEHKQIVADFRNGKLKSWESQMKILMEKDLKNNENSALDFIIQKPGMMVRMVAWLVRLDYSKKEIRQRLVKNAKELSTQTLVTILTYFGKENQEKEKEFKEVYKIFYSVLRAKLKHVEVPFKNKKVYLDTNNYSLENSNILCNNKSVEGGYMQSGIAFKIPEDVNILRFFVYWNDKKSIDIDLHAFATDSSMDEFHVGWNGHYNKKKICHSGDITHSDAAEYIDVDLREDIKSVGLNINSFRGEHFNTIETCFTGMLAVNSIKENVALYNPKNCFFSHNLNSDMKYMKYGYIDVEKRTLMYIGQDLKNSDYCSSDVESFSNILSKFTMKEYIDLLFKTQKVEVVETKEEADFIISLDKSKEENSISLIDENFYLDN